MADKKDDKPEENDEGKKPDEKKPDDKEKPDERPAEGEKPTAEALQKELTELKKTVGEQGSAFNQLKEFADGSSIVIQTIAGNPELTKAFQAEVQKRYPPKGVSGEQPPKEGETKDTPPPPSDEVKATVDDVAKSQRKEIVSSFEKNFGIDKMKKEERAEARKKVAGYLADFGWKIETIPLQVLGQNLEKAYVGTHAEKLREDGKLEGIAKARELASGTMPSIAGGAPATGEEEGKLTPAQKGWTKKLGVDEDKAAKRYKARDEEKTRVSAAEQKKK